MEPSSQELLHIQDSVVYDPAQVHPLLPDMDSYRKMYSESIRDGNSFWKKMASELTWFHPFGRVCSVDLSDESAGIPEDGCVSWFEGGKLNACYNAVDRHVMDGRGNKVALLHEANEVGVCRKVTFETLLKCVSQVANALLSMNVKKGDVVTIYMPMVPETVYCMLACARIGAVTNLIFSGFSSSALATRLQSTRSRVLLTADRLSRGNRLVELMPVVKDALLVCPHVEYCVVYQGSGKSGAPGEELNMADQLRCQSHSSALSELSNCMAGIVQNFHHLVFYDFIEWMEKERMYCPCEWMDSEDPLFVLYTSGSTGLPKGMIHTTGGYLTYALLTHRYLFRVGEDDVYACMTDLGWITGHTYVVWGPLLNGTTTCMFESTPLYPEAWRYWDFVQRYKVNVFYTAPTAIRAVMKYGEGEISKYDLSTLRVLGTVGEPISPSAWEWYYRVVGKGRCAIVDSYWMTESGGIMFAPIPGVTPMKPGSCCLPFFGIKPTLIDPNSRKELTSTGVKGVMCVSRPWPAMARGMHGDYKRFVSTYFGAYPRYFFTGDGAYLDKDGYFWITGRLDDVINVSGHRLSTAEIEASLASHGTCTEVAVVGIPHDIKGQSICAFCVAKKGYESQENLAFELCQHVRRTIASMAMPDKLYLVPALPKTRSGKLMRRLLRKIAAFEFDSMNDTSTLAEAEVIDHIIEVVCRQENRG